MKYKILATDLDGTLFSDNNVISEENLKYLKKASGIGVKVVLVSGRGEFSVIDVARQVGLYEDRNYVISFNGGKVTELTSEKTIFEKRLAKDYALYIVERAGDFDVSAIGYIGNKAYTNRDSEAVRYYNRRTNKKVVIDKNFALNANEDFSKIVFIGEYEELVKVKDFFQNWADGKMAVFFTERTLLEFVDLEVSKGNALIMLANILGVDSSEIIAVGDSYNDISMLELAGMPISPANADDDIKKLCKYVTKASNNEDVLKEIVLKYIM